MIILKIRIKSDNCTYLETHYLEDNFTISKQNPLLEDLVQKACINSHIEDIQDVILTAKLEW